MVPPTGRIIGVEGFVMRSMVLGGCVLALALSGHAAGADNVLIKPEEAALPPSTNAPKVPLTTRAITRRPDLTFSVAQKGRNLAVRFAVQVPSAWRQQHQGEFVPFDLPEESQRRSYGASSALRNGKRCRNGGSRGAPRAAHDRGQDFRQRWPRVLRRVRPQCDQVAACNAASLRAEERSRAA